MSLLRDNQEIHKALKDIFSHKGRRRVALVAFVGIGAEKLLPTPEGVELICWPKAGGTHPHALRALRTAKCKISFVEGLHTKLYWCEGKGAIIGSANLSKNGLMKGGLHEAAWLLPPDAISATELDAMLHELKPQAMSQARLEQLDNETSRFDSETEQVEFLGKAQQPQAKVSSLPFEEWLRERFREKRPPDWRICISFSSFSSKDEKRLVSQDYLDTGNQADYWSGTKGVTKPHQWVLYIDCEDGFDADWAYPDTQKKVQSDDKKWMGEWDYLAIQNGNNPRNPPFRISKQLSRVIKEYLKDNEITDDNSAEQKFPDGGISLLQLQDWLKRLKVTVG